MCLSALLPSMFVRFFSHFFLIYFYWLTHHNSRWIVFHVDARTNGLQLFSEPIFYLIHGFECMNLWHLFSRTTFFVTSFCIKSMSCFRLTRNTNIDCIRDVEIAFSAVRFGLLFSLNCMHRTALQRTPFSMKYSLLSAAHWTIKMTIALDDRQKRITAITSRLNQIHT